MRQVNLRLDTLYSAIEMLESGTTTVQHINSGLSGPEENWDRSTEEIISAYGEIGMRSGYCFMIRDQNILSYEDDAKVLAALPEEVCEWLAPSMQAAQTHPRLYGFFQPAASQMVRAQPGHGPNEPRTGQSALVQR